MRSSGKRATPEPKSPDRPTQSFRSLPSLYASYFFAVFFRCSDCARRRSSCSRSSGVNSAPKSSASNTWRISISDSPSWGLGQRLTHSIASSRDFTSIIQKPATSWLVSGDGPSTTVRVAPENFTRAPFALGCSPSPARSTPAFISSSLYLPISASSLSMGIWPASEALLALTRIMKRIVVPPSITESNGTAPDRHRISVVDRLIGRGPEVQVDGRQQREHGALGHQDRHHVLGGVGRPRGAIAAIPAEPPRHRRQVVAPGHHRHPEPPAAALPLAGEEARRRLLVRGQVIGGL